MDIQRFLWGNSLIRTFSAVFLFVLCLGGDVFLYDDIFLLFYLYFTLLSFLFLIFLRKDPILKLPLAMITLIPFIGICFLSLFWSVRLKDAEIVIVSFLTGLLTYLLFSNTIDEEDDLYFFLKSIVIATSLNALVGIFQGTIGGSLFTLFGSSAQGTTYHPNFFAGLLGIVYPLAILMMIKENKKIWFLPSFLILLASLFSASRGGILTIILISAVSLAFLFLKGYKKLGIKILFTLLLSVLFYLPFVSLRTTSYNPLSKLSVPSISSTSYSRIEIWKGTLPILLHQPFLGSGLRSFEDQFKFFNNPYLSRFHSNAHNLFLHLASEVGLIGLLFFLALCSWILLSSIGSCKKAVGLQHKILSFFLLLAFSSFLFQNLFEYKWEHPLFQVLFYFIASALFTCKRLLNHGKEQISFRLPRPYRIGLSGLLIIFWVLYVGSPLIGNYFLSKAKPLLAKKDEKIIRYLGKASFFDSANPEPYLLLSQTYESAWFITRDSIFFEKAVNAREKAIQRFPMNADFYLDMAKSLEDAKRLDRAKKYYEKALSVNPFSPRYKEEFAAFFARNGEMDQAIVLWDGLLNFFEKYEPEGMNLIRIYLHLGRAYKERGDFEASKRYLSKVVHFPEQKIKETDRENFASYKKAAVKELGN